MDEQILENIPAGPEKTPTVEPVVDPDPIPPELYTVYIQIDDASRIVAINSSAFLPSTEGWTAIDSGMGDRYHHAQGNYFPKPIYDERGIPRYKLVNIEPVERDQEEMDADYVARPKPEPTNEELLLEMAADHEYRICLMELGVTENDL